MEDPCCRRLTGSELSWIAVVRSDMTLQSRAWAPSEGGETCLGTCSGPPLDVPGYEVRPSVVDMSTVKRRAVAVAKHVEVGMVILGTFLVAWQLKQANEHREMENSTAIIERTQEHNWSIVDNELRRSVVEVSERLYVAGQSKEIKNEYWAARAVHLSHLNLLWHVWELEGRPSELSEHHAGWTRFAKAIMVQISQAPAPPRGSPAEWAAYDLWKGLKSYEVYPPEFVEWLERLIAENRGR